MRSNIIYAVQLMMQVVVRNKIKVQVQGYHKTISVKAGKIRCMITGVTRYQLERATTVGLQLCLWYLQLTTGTV